MTHDDELTADRHKLAAFLSGWLGGPPLYWESADPVRRNERHRALTIADAAKSAWLLCRSVALSEAGATLRATLLRRFQAAAAGVQKKEAAPSITE